MLHYQILSTWLQAKTKSEEGASLVEYALLVALIAVVAIGAISLLGDNAEETFTTINTEIDKAQAKNTGT